MAWAQWRAGVWNPTLQPQVATGWWRPRRATSGGDRAGGRHTAQRRERLTSARVLVGSRHAVGPTVCAGDGWMSARQRVTPSRKGRSSVTPMPAPVGTGMNPSAVSSGS